MSSCQNKISIAKYCDQLVCVSVCWHYLKTACPGRTRCHQIFGINYNYVTCGYDSVILSEVQYVIYVRFCRWRHVFTKWKKLARIRRRVCFIHFARRRHRERSLPPQTAYCFGLYRHYFIGITTVVLYSITSTTTLKLQVIRLSNPSPCFRAYCAYDGSDKTPCISIVWHCFIFIYFYFAFSFDKFEKKIIMYIIQEILRLTTSQNFSKINKLDGCIVLNANNYYSNRSARLSVHKLFTTCIRWGPLSRDSIVDGDMLPATE